MRERFLKAVRNHKMIVEQDNGVHRCLLFKAPNTGIYSFRLVTWPGHLAISGDLDDYTFSRLHDMFEFFHYAGPEYTKTDEVNYGYWAEKAQATYKHGMMKFEPKFYLDSITHGMDEHVSMMDKDDMETCWDDARERGLFEEPCNEHEALDMVMGWTCPVTHTQPFQDFWDHRLQDYSFGFKFSCHAIQWGIKQYDLYKQGRTQEDENKLILSGKK